MNTEKTLSAEKKAQLASNLRARFSANPRRHEGIAWEQVEERLEARPDKWLALSLMEETGGEPDVTGRDEKTGEILFMDCAPQSPEGRRSLCYDEEALNSRKENKPRASAQGMADGMGIGMLDEAQYLQLQRLGEFDSKTSSWIRTPEAMRRQGGALFGDQRYGRVFFYHNGAESYYSGRGFRGVLKV